ncbi:glycosyltransferase family 2 protein [Candidatus Peregrinibacteria bacterium]|nr:glycosyltransferase family 2 protein [Candidatus Peregrinibacteria bacterium]
MKTKVLIGLLTYNDLHYMKEVIPILEQLRTELPATIAVIDTAHNDEIRDFFKKKFPKIEYFRHDDGNIGYGRGNSEIIKKFPGHDYYLCCTNDVLLNVPVVKKVLKSMEKDKKISMAVGKLYHWDFDNHRRTKIIDSFGIVGEKRHHFHDRGQGEEDMGQYDADLNGVFGISGATFIIRTSVIPKLHGSDWELFDPRMWMYKEDIDLAYRLRLLGEKITIFPRTWGWHARTVANTSGQSLGNLTKAQKGKADYSRRHSYRNHFILLKNHVTWKYGIRVVIKMLIFEGMKGLYMLFRHPSVFVEGLKALLFVPGRRINKRVSTKKMLTYFQ